MKKLLTLGILTMPVLVLAQEAGKLEAVIGGSLIVEIATKYPILLSVVAIMGTLRAIFKAARLIVESTKTKKDDDALNKVERSKIVKGLFWILDYFASIKFPVK